MLFMKILIALSFSAGRLYLSLSAANCDKPKKTFSANNTKKALVSLGITHLFREGL